MMRKIAKIIGLLTTGLSSVALFAAVLFASCPCVGPYYEADVPDALKEKAQ